jgi:exopolyphosphatase/guanosine-5'-triphosphate,3'-diphosphate pyrophosphatase
MPQEIVKIAVVDLGTNTFHAVIFQKEENRDIHEIYRKRHFVFLSKGGSEIISQDSFNRAVIAVEDFKLAFEKHEPHEIHIVGTAALRTASNGKELSNFIEKKLLSHVDIISGKREAELISKGVLWQFENRVDEAMIIDIGGGSVEFIHIKNNEILWLDSYPIGVGVLYNKFKHQDPISPSEIQAIIQFLVNETKEMISYISSFNIKTLIGASGSFELIPAIMEGQYPPEIEVSSISKLDFLDIKARILSMNLLERQNTKGLPEERVNLAVVAFVLMDWIIGILSPDELLISKYAVKEGLAKEVFDHYNY